MITDRDGFTGLSFGGLLTLRVGKPSPQLGQLPFDET
jgi:hypothetical protein